MGDTRRVALVVVAVLALGALGGGLWYVVHLSSQETPPKPLRWAQNARLHRGFQLIPVPQDPSEKAPPLEEVWRDLFPKMAKDAQTRQLIGEMLGRTPYQFVVLDSDEKAAEDALPKLPPAEGAIILGVGPSPTWREMWRHPNGVWQSSTRPGPDSLEADQYIRCLDVGLTLAYLEHSPSGMAEIKNVEIMAANEYLVRHRLGCLLCTELNEEDFRAVVGSAEAARAYEARQIAQWRHP
jgi:hypothetical protein